MKTTITCMQCLREYNLPGPLYINEIPDNGIFHLYCDKGHETNTIIQQHKFELLFDFGISALCDGYYREAVVNFAAALERFYEFYISFVITKRNIDFNQFQNYWKQFTNSSERQYGAYVFLYLLEHPNAEQPFINDKRPKPGMKKWIEFRNDVVHKGHFASENDAYLYGELVYNFLKEQVNELLINDLSFVHKTVSNYLSTLHQNINKQETTASVSTLCLPTIISLSSQINNKTFLDAYNDFKNNPLRNMINNGIF